MSKPIETLMNEHRVIESVLDALESFAATVDPGSAEDRQTAGQFASFFSGFADRCHHGKEEDLLFKALVDLGMPRDDGPIGVMLEEHELGRACVRRIAAIASGEGAWREDELSDFRDTAADFVPLLRAHIEKEDNALFPSADGALSAEQLSRLDERFADFDREEIGTDKHRELVELARTLSQRWAG